MSKPELFLLVEASWPFIGLLIGIATLKVVDWRKRS